MSNNSLYPDILFHFTKKKLLYEILKTNFKLSYAREKIIAPSNNREFAVPMVSFCDLKLSELKSFIKKYGDFGIGMSKSWANRNGLNPVLYVNRHCDLTDNLITGLNGVYHHLSKLNNQAQHNNLSQSYLNIMNTYRYIKNYEGELKRDGKIIDSNYRFADEREWRYVPSIINVDVQAFIPITKIKTSQQKQFYNNKIKHLSLSFHPDDIKYLIVEKDSDISELIDHLEAVKGRYNKETRNILASRILTVSQINNDI